MAQQPQAVVQKTLYHSTGFPNANYHIADGVIEQAVFEEHNHFGESIGSSAKGEASAAFKQRNAAGRVWKDNLDEGAVKLRLQDLQGNLTGVLSADDIDLTNITENQIDDLLKMDRAKVLLAIFGRDKKGGLSYYKSPASHRFGPGQNLLFHKSWTTGTMSRKKQTVEVMLPKTRLTSSIMSVRKPSQKWPCLRLMARVPVCVQSIIRL